MTEQQGSVGSEAAQSIRAFLASHDARDPADREAVYRIRARVHGELYRREREHYPEYVDLGGEA